MTLDELRALATVKDGPHTRFQPPYRQMSVTLEEANLLYALVRALKPRNVLELGTGLGLSGRFIGEALKENGDDAFLYTIEPDESLHEKAYELLDGAPAAIVPNEDYGGDYGLVYIDSRQSDRRHDIKTWLSNGYKGLVLVHDAERDYPELDQGVYGVGVYLPTANGMWLGRSKGST